MATPQRTYATMLSEESKKLLQPCHVRGPRRAGDVVAVGKGIFERQADEGAAGERHLRSARRVRADLAALEHAGGSENLRCVADGGDGLARRIEVPDDGQDLLVQSQVLRRAPAGVDQRVVIIGLDLREGRVEREVVAALFRVGLIALEVVDRGADLLAGLFAGAYGIDARSEERRVGKEC